MKTFLVCIGLMGGFYVGTGFAYAHMSWKGVLRPSRILYRTPPHRGCGWDRWAVKTAVDGLAEGIVREPRMLRIPEIMDFELPRDLTFSPDRRDPIERTVYQVTDVELYGYKLESDGDYHLLLKDGGASFVAEIPDASCLRPGPFKSQIEEARLSFERSHVSDDRARRWVHPHEVITLRGVGFMDEEHGQYGAARNGFEIHPVTAWCVGRGCSLPAVVASAEKTPKR